jgi:hypothetical protein
MSDYSRWREMIDSIDADIEQLQSALAILNQVWIGKKPDAEGGLFKAIEAIGGEIALLQRKRVEAEYFMKKAIG